MNDKASAVASHEQQDGASNRRLPMPGKVGFVGLGRMGAAMATNLLRPDTTSSPMCAARTIWTSSRRSVSPHDRHHQPVRLRHRHQHAA